MSNGQADPCRIVLVRPSQAGNVGSVARVMYNFGLEQLYLLQPQVDPHGPEAVALATHAFPLLQSARCCQTWDEAVGDCEWVLGTSARLGGMFRSQSVVTPREIFPMLRRRVERGRIALVFGPERTGLLTEEIARCHYLLTIPAAQTYPVLNLAQAVACCVYEWFQQGLELNPAADLSLVAKTSKPPPTASSLSAMEREGDRYQPASFADQEQVFQHLEAALSAIHFLWNEKAPAQMHALRHLIGRAQPTKMEVQLLHGVARQLLWYVGRHGSVKGEAAPPSDET